MKQDGKEENDKLCLALKYNAKEVDTRWRKYFVGVDIEDKCNDVEIEPACGCCTDPPIYARPYFTERSIKIYSLVGGTIFPCIGYRDPFFGIYPLSDSNIRSNYKKFRKGIIDKILDYIEDKKIDSSDE